MYIAQQETMSYHTINNFRSSRHANQLIKKCFLCFRKKFNQRRFHLYCRKLRKDHQPQAKKYETDQTIFNRRNSFSKTDHDTIFMWIKNIQYLAVS